MDRIRPPPTFELLKYSLVLQGGVVAHANGRAGADTISYCCSQPAINVGQLFVHAFSIGFSAKVGDVQIRQTAFCIDVSRQGS